MSADKRDPAAPIAITDAALAAVYEHARETFPAECCGYIRGPRDPDPSAQRDPRGAAPIGDVVRCRNAQPDGEHPTVPERGAETGFVIAGAELLAFARSLDTDQPARILYHSHTHGRAYFSEVDRDIAAGPGGPYYPVQHLVVGIAADGVTEAAQFGWSDDAQDFVELARWTVPR